MSFFRGISAAGIMLAALAGGGCGWLANWSEPPDPYAKLRRQPGVVRLPDSPLGGRIELTYRGSDFAESSLELPEGDYVIVVKNEDSLTDIGFFLRKPDRYGRETAGHVAAGGGIRMGSEGRFEVSLLKDSSYLFNEPVTESPSHQITVIAAAVRPAPAAAFDEEQVPDGEAEFDASPGEEAAPSTDEADSSSEADVESIAESTDEGDSAEETAPKADDEPAFSPEVERLLDAFDRAEEPR